jgi:hypothetical protein
VLFQDLCSDPGAKIHLNQKMVMDFNLLDSLHLKRLEIKQNQALFIRENQAWSWIFLPSGCSLKEDEKDNS